jgi:hypothetical protein
MNDLFRRQYGVAVKAAASGDARAFDVVASTDDVDMQGEVLTQDWDLRRFNQNPVVLYLHNMCGWDPEDTLPVGFATDVGVIDGKLRATLHFVTENANPMAELCYQGFAQGSLRAVSVGFRSKLGRMETRNGSDVFVLSGNELLEISVAPLPINPNAVVDKDVTGSEDGLGYRGARASNKTSRDQLEAFCKSFITHASQEAARDQEIRMKTLLKALGLKDDATEAEALSAFTVISSGAKSLEGKVLEATGTKSVDEAFGAIKAGATALGQVADLTKSLETARGELAKRDRDSVISKGVAEGKLTPALKEWAEGQPLEAVKSFLEKAPVHAALASGAGGSTTGASTGEAPPGAGAKAWEDMSPAEKHDLKVANEALYASAKADWERRGKPAMKWAAKK